MKTWNSPAVEDRSAFPMVEVFSAGEKNHHISNTAYPIAHGQTWKPYRSIKEDHLRIVENAFRELDEFALYTHIPFCETRCYFCEYTVVGKSDLERTQEYMQYLSKELKRYSSIFGKRTLSGFDIGGGTPSFVAADLIASHIDEVRKQFNTGSGFEISIETTPRIASLDPEKIREYVNSGINRISMGLQVTQPDLLKALGRETNGVEHHFNAADNIRKAGFNKFNIDLMYGFAAQSLASWEATLLHALSLSPEYITLYRMRYKLTRISHQASQVELEQVHNQSKLAREILNGAGYHANPGKNTYSRIEDDTGTSAYLTRRVIQGVPYLGIGLGAQTFTDTTISYNCGAAGKNLDPYFRSLDSGDLPIQDLYDLPLNHMMAKMIAVSFYFGEINLGCFRNKFGITLEEAFPAAVSYAFENGLMDYTVSSNGAELNASGKNDSYHHDHKSFSLTPKGAKYFNGTIALFFAPSVQKYLIERNPEEAEDMHRSRKSALAVAERNGT